jgi:hypothetical protein
VPLRSHVNNPSRLTRHLKTQKKPRLPTDFHIPEERNPQLDRYENLKTHRNQLLIRTLSFRTLFIHQQEF